MAEFEICNSSEINNFPDEEVGCGSTVLLSS